MSFGSILRRRSLWLTLLAALLFGVLAYQFRPAYTIPVGSWYDRVAIRDGWWGDELADNQRYRWSSGHASIELANFGKLVSASYELRIDVRPYTKDKNAVPITVTVGGRPIKNPVGINTLEPDYYYYYYLILPSEMGSAGSSPRISIEMPTFSVVGDSRNLGVKVTGISLYEAGSDDFSLVVPPLLSILYLMLIALVVYLIFYRRSRLSIPAALFAAVSIVYSTLINLPFGVWLLPAATVLILALLLITWRRELFGWYPPLLARLRALPSIPSPISGGGWGGGSQRIRFSGETEAKDVGAQFIAPPADARQGVMNHAPTEAHDSKLKTQNSKLTLTLIVAIAIYAIFALWLVAQVDFIGHADYADNAVVARNIVHGLGASSDYAAQFYTRYPSVQHAADTWPLLQPLITVPFLLISDTTFAAKLPNLILMLLLAASVFYVGRRIWDARVALLAAILVLVHPAFLATVVYPINDLAFTLLFLWLLYIVVTRRLSNVADWRAWAAFGLFAGLLIWSKPSGATLLVALFGYALFITRRRNQPPLTPTLSPWGRGGVVLLTPALSPQERGEIVRQVVISSAIVIAVTLVVISPLLIRNLTTFDAPFYSTEGYDAWVLKWNPPFERIYAYWPPNDLPNRSWLLRYGYDAIYRGIGREAQALWAGNSPTGGGSGLFGNISDILSQPHYDITRLISNGEIFKPFTNGDIGSTIAVMLAIFALFVVPRLQQNPLSPPGERVGERGRVDSYVGQRGEQQFAPTNPVTAPLLLSLVVYAAFLVLYWHYEARYFYAYIPWVCLLAAAGIFWLYDVTAGNANPGRVRKIRATVLAAALAAMLIVPSTIQIYGDTISYAGATPLVEAAQWFEAHTPPGAVAMSRNPWEFSWHSQRLVVMIPNDPQDINRSLPQIKAAAQEYNASYLMLDHLGGPGATYFRSDWRRDIAPMYNQRTACTGFSLVYQNKSVAIYKMDVGKIGTSCRP